MTRILIPSPSADAWASLLAEENHWKPGRSAWALAHAWQDANGFPARVDALLATSPTFASAELVFGIPEHRVPLPGGARPSQTDLWALAHTARGLASIAVEGKMTETFGPTVGEWLVGASPGKRERLEFLRELLGLVDPVPAALRYQLLHRTASAILEARRFLAPDALLLVHSFSEGDEGYRDFENFADALGVSVEPGRLVAVPGFAEPTLHLGWVRDALPSVGGSVISPAPSR
jgi:hypothetical protein